MRLGEGVASQQLARLFFCLAPHRSPPSSRFDSALRAPAPGVQRLEADAQVVARGAGEKEREE